MKVPCIQQQDNIESFIEKEIQVEKDTKVVVINAQRKQIMTNYY